MRFVESQKTSSDLSFYRKEQNSGKNHKYDVYELADKYGLVDILNKDIPDANSMDELNEQILTIEVVIRSLRKHVQSQYQRLSRTQLSRG